MSTASSVVFPSPDTYLNHLSPQEAHDYEATRNVLLVLLGATIWDILATLSYDIKVLRRSRFHFATFCFLFSRYFALAGVVSHVIRRTMTIHNLHAVVTSGIILCGMSLGCSSYLFLQRTRAVYAGRPQIQRSFTIFWIVMNAVSTSILVFSIKPVYIEETRQFKDSGIQPLMSLAALVSVAYESVVVLAISYEIGMAHIVIDREMGWKRYIWGNALPRLSQAVLRSGQQYYFLVLLVDSLNGIVLYIPFVPPILKSTFVVFPAPLMASMSCRVYRNIKLFEYDLTVPYPISEIQFAEFITDNRAGASQPLTTDEE